MFEVFAVGIDAPLLGRRLKERCHSWRREWGGQRYTHARRPNKTPTPSPLLSCWLDRPVGPRIENIPLEKVTNVMLKYSFISSHTISFRLIWASRRNEEEEEVDGEQKPVCGRGRTRRVYALTPLLLRPFRRGGSTGVAPRVP